MQMFVMREEHLRAFREEFRLGFARRTVPLLRKQFPKELASDEDPVLISWVMEVVEFLDKYDITQEADIRLYCELSIEYPGELRCQPLPDWTRRILEDPIRASEFKVSDIEQRLESGGSYA